MSAPVPALLESIEIPDTAYETARSRYEDLGDWLCRPESSLSTYNPVVFPQGSFLLGTVTRPLNTDGEYDLDLAIKLRRGVSKRSHTQRQLKQMVGVELEAYRKARGIKAELDEKRRCWRLEYADQMSFHIDAVPCIPEDDRRQQMVKEAIVTRDAAAAALADDVAPLTVSITDNARVDDYDVLCDDWNVSNPQGYGRWFAGRVRLARQTVRDRLRMEKRAEVEELPTYKLKAPLQRVVQLLKLHRDEMFKDDPDRQPISIIITTLAARAYDGQEDVTEALLHVVDTMDQHLHDSTPRVPNPVNPEEDFSDKWDTEEGQRLELKRHFHLWLIQARADFHAIARSDDADTLEKRAEQALGVKLDRQRLRERLGPRIAAPAVVTSPRRIEQAPRPWSSQ
jgi:hypothetical protein